MKLGNGNHLMYCLNIHPGESLEEVKSAIRQYAAAVKAAVCPGEPFALGLRLSRLAASELLPMADDFKAFLDDSGFYAVTINGFPYGQFHGRRVKEDVYLPDWTCPERTAYTLDLARILAKLLPEGEIGTISTVPCHYGKQAKPEAMNSLLSMADELARIEQETGKRSFWPLSPSRIACSTPRPQHSISLRFSSTATSVHSDTSASASTAVTPPWYSNRRSDGSASSLSQVSPSRRSRYRHL